MDVNYIGRMRANLLHYAEFMDLFGPCVVPVSHWNNYQVRQTACHNPHMLDLLLSASDESFILLILVSALSLFIDIQAILELLNYDSDF